MQEDQNEYIFTIDELIEKLETIREEKNGSLNVPKAILTLAKHIKSIEFNIESIRKARSLRHGLDKH